MKTISHINRSAWIAGVFTVLLAAAGCTGNFEEINRNPNEVTEAEMQRENYKTGANVKGLINLVVPAQEHMYQFNELLVSGSYAGYTEFTSDSKFEKFSTFNPTVDWLKWPFVNVISETYPYYRGVLNGTDNPVMRALADLLRVAIMHRVTDTYGPIPYSKVVEDKKESLSVGYDTQKEAYMKMFEELDAAIAVLKANASLSTEAFGKFDGVYGGNVGKWVKFANSLKLRMAMRLSNVEPEIAKAKAAEAIGSGVIESNEDNAELTLAENRSALCWTNWNDHRIGADLISVMNGYNDPRRETMFTKVTVGKGETATQGFAGIRIGVYPGDSDAVKAGYSNMIIDSKSPYLWMNAAEITFLRAEYELRWGTDAAAGSLYEQAVKLSFEERGAKGAEDYLAQADAVPENYQDNVGSDNCSAVSKITIPWETGNFDRNLERIITQKWIAIFPLGTEAWAEHRRTGYPALFPAVNDKSGGSVDPAIGPRRLNYPVEEYTENAANVAAAVEMLGGPDTQGTHLWWDKTTSKN